MLSTVLLNNITKGEIYMLVVAYIGFGKSVCRYHLPYVERRPDKVKVKYIYRRAEDVEREGTESEKWYPEITFTTNLDLVMNDPEVNLIVVNAPNAFHVGYTKMAIEHGKNVLCEKPFAMTAKEAEEVFALAKEKGVVVTSNQNRRFDADILTVKKVIESGVLGEILEFESHYDYYRPGFPLKRGPKTGTLLGLVVHPLDQVIGLFSIPKKVVYDVKSFDFPGESDDYVDLELHYGKMKAIVKTSYFVKLDYPSFIVHGRKGSLLLPALGHQSAIAPKPGKVEISFEPLSEEHWGTLSYIDDEGNDITKKVPIEVGDYGLVYDNLYDAIFNGAEKCIKDEEVVFVLKTIEEGIMAAKNFKC